MTKSKLKVGVYISHLNAIGGVETFGINLCNRTGFDLIYFNASMLALKKLHNANAFQLKHTDYDYDVLILGTAWGEPPSEIKAKKYIQVIHADYEAYIQDWNFTYKKYDYTTHHVCVGNYVARQFEKVTGYKCDKVINNLLTERVIKKPRIKKEPLRLVTISRISKEKGFMRMVEMAEMINIPFVWDVYGDVSTSHARQIMSLTNRLNFLGVTDRVLDIVPDYHYLVQLSDTEGFPYSVYESLQCLTPVITTDYPSVHELIKDGENGYILDMQLSNFCVNKIKSIPLINSFKEKSSEEDWFKFINDIIT